MPPERAWRGRRCLALPPINATSQAPVTRPRVVRGRATGLDAMTRTRAPSPTPVNWVFVLELAQPRVRRVTNATSPAPATRHPASVRTQRRPTGQRAPTVTRAPRATRARPARASAATQSCARHRTSVTLQVPATRVLGPAPIPSKTMVRRATTRTLAQLAKSARPGSARQETPSQRTTAILALPMPVTRSAAFRIHR
jgi:hypothetical protein